MKKYKEALSVVLFAILAAACGRNPENMAPQHVSLYTGLLKIMLQ